jgi:hypothetical protein
VDHFCAAISVVLAGGRMEKAQQLSATLLEL